MALTIEQIHAAADEISAQGEKPTLSRVRKALGGGSFSTISEAMQSWRERQSEEHALAEVQVPDSLNERVEQLKAAAWQSAVEEAEKRLTAEREALNKAKEAASAAVYESKEAVGVLEAEARERDAEIASLKEQLAASQAETQAAAAEQHKAEQQREADAARMAERIEGLEARLADAHSVIERLTALDDSRQQREGRGPGSADNQPKLPI